MEEGGCFEWISELVGRDELLTVNDLRDGFILLQVMSIIEPEAVDWSPLEAETISALPGDDARCRNFAALKRAAEYGKASDVTIDAVTAAEERGDREAFTCLIQRIRTMYNKKLRAACSEPSAVKSRQHSPRRPHRRGSKLVSDAHRNGKQLSAANHDNLTNDVDSDYGSEEVSEDADYEATEPNFKPSGRWMLQHLLEYARGSPVGDECELLLFLLEGPNPAKVPARVIASLCRGSIYQFAADRRFRGKRAPVKILGLTDRLPRDQWTFMDDLGSQGYFSVGLKGPVKDMVADRSPFYESLHIAIIEGFMAAVRSDVTIPKVVSALRHCPRFDPGLHTPYDLEDGLVVWATLAVNDHEHTGDKASLSSFFEDLPLLRRILQTIRRRVHGDDSRTSPQTDSDKRRGHSGPETDYGSITSICGELGLAFPFTEAELTGASKCRLSACKQLAVSLFASLWTVLQDGVRTSPDTAASARRKRKAGGKSLASNCPREHSTPECKPDNPKGPRRPEFPAVFPRAVLDDASPATVRDDHLPPVGCADESVGAAPGTLFPTALPSGKTGQVRRIARRRLREVQPDAVNKARRPLPAGGGKPGEVLVPANRAATAPFPADEAGAADREQQRGNVGCPSEPEKEPAETRKTCVSSHDSGFSTTVPGAPPAAHEERALPECTAARDDKLPCNIVASGSVPTYALTLEQTDTAVHQVVDPQTAKRRDAASDQEVGLQTADTDVSVGAGYAGRCGRQVGKADFQLEDADSDADCDYPRGSEHASGLSSTFAEQDGPTEGGIIHVNEHFKHFLTNLGDGGELPTKLESEDASWTQVRRGGMAEEDVTVAESPPAVVSETPVSGQEVGESGGDADKEEQIDDATWAMGDEIAGYGEGAASESLVLVHRHEHPEQRYHPSEFPNFSQGGDECKSVPLTRNALDVEDAESPGSQEPKISSMCKSPSRSSNGTTQTDCQDGSVYFDLGSGQFYDRRSQKRTKVKASRLAKHAQNPAGEAAPGSGETNGHPDSVVESLEISGQSDARCSKDDPATNVNTPGSTAVKDAGTSRKNESFVILWEAETKKSRQKTANQPKQRESTNVIAQIKSQTELAPVFDDGRCQPQNQARERESEQRQWVEDKARMRRAKRLENNTDKGRPEADKCRPASAGIPKTPTRTSHRSNRQLVRNALVHICLAGTVNTNTKEEVLEDLDGFAGDNFVILFRGTKDHAFRALYSYDAKTSEVLKVYGTGPMSLTGAQVAEFYKYDSGSRSFKTVPTKSFGISVHGVSLAGSLRNGSQKTRKVKTS